MYGIIIALLEGRQSQRGDNSHKKTILEITRVNGNESAMGRAEGGGYAIQMYLARVQ